MDYRDEIEDDKISDSWPTLYGCLGMFFLGMLTLFLIYKGIDEYMMREVWDDDIFAYAIMVLLSGTAVGIAG